MRQLDALVQLTPDSPKGDGVGKSCQMAPFHISDIAVEVLA
jgi:hypothetical protein